MIKTCFVLISLFDVTCLDVFLLHKKMILPWGFSHIVHLFLSRKTFNKTANWGQNIWENYQIYTKLSLHILEQTSDLFSLSHQQKILFFFIHKRTFDLIGNFPRLCYTVIQFSSAWKRNNIKNLWNVGLKSFKNWNLEDLR